MGTMKNADIWITKDDEAIDRARALWERYLRSIDPFEECEAQPVEFARQGRALIAREANRRRIA